ncbi:MAG: winged helix-turn-helix transcriptional regulator [Clostridia bacterium]|nr:winged helix-turn-helix transcriptional regulator [Clostridia bacterium]
MIRRFKEFTKYISLAYKYLIKIKSDGIKEFGLKGSHVMCLFYIGESENGLTATNLCQLCCEDKAAVSKTLSALCEKGYVVLENGENKKYRSSYFLTDAGKEIMNQLNEKIRAAVIGGGTGLSDEEREVFYRCLFKIVDNLEAVSKSFSVSGDEE